MSLIVSIRTGEGIVMASDSRMTTTVRRVADSESREFIGAHFSDTTYKTFLLRERIGVSTCGGAFIKGRAVAGWMQDFESEHYDEGCSVLMCAQRLALYFGGLKPESELIFHIGGYEVFDGSKRPVVYRLLITSDGNIDLPPADVGFGARWDGQREILTRLLKSCYVISDEKVVKLGDVVTEESSQDGHGKKSLHRNMLGIPQGTLHFPDTNIDFSTFTLQDAVDFAEYAIKTTIDSMRFKSEPLTVATPIDVLVITPEKADWLARKKLHARE